MKTKKRKFVPLPPPSALHLFSRNEGYQHRSAAHIRHIKEQIEVPWKFAGRMGGGGRGAKRREGRGGGGGGINVFAPDEKSSGAFRLYVNIKKV